MTDVKLQQQFAFMGLVSLLGSRNVNIRSVLLLIVAGLKDISDNIWKENKMLR